MISSYSPNKPVLTLTLVTALGSLSACTSLHKVREASFDPAAVAKMQLHFSQSELFGVKLPEQDIAANIAANLAEWGYVVEVAPDTSASHRLSVDIGTVERGATPVGISFDAGNSDPRALDFQKSDVLPITCGILPKDQRESGAELGMGFMAEDYMKAVENDDGRDKLAELLENDIGTVCYNLLDQLNVPIAKTEGEAKRQEKPAWIPEIRLETENESESDTGSAPEKNVLDKEIPFKRGIRRRRIVIHHQGSPVIFKLGHERK